FWVVIFFAWLLFLECVAAGVAALVAFAKAGVDPDGFSKAFFRIFIAIHTLTHPLPVTAYAIGAAAVFFAGALVVLRARRVLASLYRISRWERSQKIAELRADVADFLSFGVALLALSWI